jgi:hypothetical protein
MERGSKRKTAAVVVVIVSVWMIYLNIWRRVEEKQLLLVILLEILTLLLLHKPQPLSPMEYTVMAVVVVVVVVEVEVVWCCRV